MSPTPYSISASQLLMSNVTSLPLWVKQYIYFELQRELMGHFTQATLSQLTTEDMVTFFSPRLTKEGESVQIQDEKLALLLTDARNRLTVLDICLHQGWTLEVCSAILLEAMELKWINPPNSEKALATFEYLANRTRLGEFLVKMGRLTTTQLEQALRTQQYIKEALDEHAGIANILINLGYITRQDTEGILFLKEESRKPLDNNSLFQNLLSSN